MFLELQQESTQLGRRPTGFTEHYYTEWVDDSGREKISLFMVLGLSNSKVPAKEFGKTAFQVLQDEFLGEPYMDPYERFEDALRAINTATLKMQDELGLNFIPNVNMVVGVLQRDKLFLSQRGEAHAYLLRKRHLSPITEGLSDAGKKKELFQNIASGSLEAADGVFFLTGPLMQYMSGNDLARLFTEHAASKAMTLLRKEIHEDMEEQIAMMVFEVLEKSSVPAHVDMVMREKDEIHEESLEKEIDLVEDSGLESPLEAFSPADHEKVLWDDDTKELHSSIKLSKRVSLLKSFLPKRHLLKIASVLFLIVLVFVGFSVVTGRQQGKMQAAEDKLRLAEEKVVQASTRGSFDKDAATVLLDDAELLAAELIQSGLMGPEASQILDDIADQRDFLDNVIRVDEEIRLLTDFTGLLGKGQIVGLTQKDDKHIVYTDHEVFEVLIDEAEAPGTLDEDFRAISGAPFEDQENLVFVLEDGNFLEYTDGNAQLADTSDVDWKEGTAVATYSNKIYILDPGSNQIWRYTRGTSAYGGAQTYFSGETDISGAVSLAIDGFVWVLKSSGEILKYLSGAPENFVINKAPSDDISGASKVITDIEMSQLFVLNSAKNRIFVYSKSERTGDLTFDNQFVFEGLRGSILDFYYDKDRKAFVFVTEDKLYEYTPSGV